MKFADDDPIQDSSDDLLGREMFVEKLAEAISTATPTSSFVIALYGPWGSGKSSIKNLLLNQLKTQGGEITILEFSPWLISGQEQLIEAFFRDLWVKLRGSSDQENQRGAAKTLGKLSAYSGLLTHFTKAGATVLATIKPEYAIPAAAVAAGAEQISELTKRASADQKAISDLATKTLAESKRELAETFRRRHGTVLIVIDDIDRLTNEEVRLLFRLIRSNADFPKFIFLLLFDRHVVATALDAASPDRGEAYLEKIVQVGFDVPEPGWGDLLEVLQTEMRAIVRSWRTAKARFNEERWTRIASELRVYFSTIRSVRRVMNSVRFTFGLFQHEGGFDANTEDIFGIETLRNYEPNVYKRLPKLKSFLTRSGLAVADYLEDRRPGADEKKQQILRELLELTVPEHRDTVRKLLGELFPNARWGSVIAEDAALLRDMRVAHPDYFDRYFQLLIPEQSIRSTEVTRAVTAARSKNKFEAMLRTYLRAGRLSLLVRHLRANIGLLAPHIENVVAATFGMGDAIEDRSWYVLGTTEQNDLANLVRDILEQIRDRDQRAKLLIALVDHSTGLAMPYHVVVPECDEETRQKRLPDAFLTDEPYLPELKRALIGRIEALRNSEIALRTTDSVGALLYTWDRWGDGTHAGRWLLENRNNADLIWGFLLASTSSIQGIHSQGIASLSLDWLTKFVPLEEVDTLVDDLRAGEVGQKKRTFFAVYDRTRQTPPTPRMG
jgi:predicted KAP-like P-loop ATPase